MRPRQFTEARTQGDANRRAIAMDVVSDEQRPWMKLTAYDSATGFYSWVEQEHTLDGVFTTKIAGRTGTPLYQPAREVNGTEVGPLPYYVRADATVLTSRGMEFRFFGTRPTATGIHWSSTNADIPAEPALVDVAHLTLPALGTYIVFAGLYITVAFPAGGPTGSAIKLTIRNATGAAEYAIPANTILAVFQSPPTTVPWVMSDRREFIFCVKTLEAPLEFDIALTRTTGDPDVFYARFEGGSSGVGAVRVD